MLAEGATRQVFGMHVHRHEEFASGCEVTPNTVELIPAIGALFPRGGPVQDPALTEVMG